MKALNENNLRIAAILPEQPHRYAIRAIRVEPDATVATDGHMLIRVGLPLNGSKPDIPNFIPAPDDFEPFLLGPEACVSIRDNLPPMSTCVIGEAKAGQFALGIKDLDGNYRTIGGPVDGSRFPERYEQTIPEREKAVFTIKFDAKLLLKALQQVEGCAGSEPLVIRLYTPDMPIRIDAVSREDQLLTAVVMPMR